MHNTVQVYFEGGKKLYVTRDLGQNEYATREFSRKAGMKGAEVTRPRQTKLSLRIGTEIGPRAEL